MRADKLDPGTGSLSRYAVQLASTKSGGWKRVTGSELAGKTIGVIGMGRIGKEVIKRARAFDMNVVGYDCYIDQEFDKEYIVQCLPSAEEVLKARKLPD